MLLGILLRFGTGK